jgi:hypothetical protein
MFTDPNPGQFNPHRVAVNLDSNLTHGDLMPLSEAQQREYPTFVSQSKGTSDMQLNIENPEADAARQKLAAMKPEEIVAFQETCTPATTCTAVTLTALLRVTTRQYNW